MSRSRRPSPRRRPPGPDPTDPPHPDPAHRHHDLVAQARRLLAQHRHDQRSLLVLAFPPGASGSSGAPGASGASGPAPTTVEVLPNADPVLGLLGRRLPDVDTIALTVPGRAHRLDTSPLPSPSPTAAPPPFGRVLHLLHRDGRSVTIVSPGPRPGPDDLVLGPEPNPVAGRLADACRRALGLATAPPPPHLVGFLVDTWLERAAALALVAPGLGWSPVVAANPVVELDDQMAGRALGAVTPATLARSMLRVGRSMRWENLHRDAVEGSWCRGHDLRSATAAWMDAGMFARWLIDDGVPRPTLLSILDGTLQPAAVDRLRAAVSLCDAPLSTVTDPLDHLP